MPAPKPLDPSQGMVARFGALLRELRGQRGWSQARLGHVVGISNSAVSKYETGEKVPPPDIARLLDGALGAGGRLLEALDRINDDPGSRWLQKFFDLETRATAFRQLVDLVPALLQTEGYIRAALSRGMTFFGGDLEEKVRFRLARAAILDAPGAPRFSAVIDERALHVCVGGPRVMAGQLSRLIAMSAKDNIRIRVTPFNGHGLLDSPSITLMTLPGGRTVVHRPDPVQDSCVTSPDIVTAYTSLYEHLESEALSEKATIDLIRNVLEEKYSAHHQSLAQEQLLQ
ncbi:helix-turn-helix domain-containing protein [Streptomyces caatingaensis]|uniref:helix-turn-helix domain-containing protein n=1 Tax=Streptomyces caatingaensis TaxID=1678637 RepID=UPI0006728455|nr:helix-turn-helix transcriptional regulator [Streptomyces caatingaensis]